MKITVADADAVVISVRGAKAAPHQRAAVTRRVIALADHNTGLLIDRDA